MAKRAGAYRSEKRKKELKRQKKQEEKRQKRLGGKVLGPDGVLEEGMSEQSGEDAEHAPADAEGDQAADPNQVQGPAA